MGGGGGVVGATVRLLAHVWANQETVNKKLGPALGPAPK